MGQIDQKRIECGHCFQVADVVLQAEQATIHVLVQDPVSGEDRTLKGIRVAGGDGAEKASVAFCPLCLKPTLLWYKRVLKQGYMDTLTDFRQFPPPRDRSLHPGWPEKVARAWDDTVRSHDAGVSPASVATSVGSCLQTACRALGCKGKNLAEEIADLRAKGHITEGMSVWATKIRFLRNAGTHEYEADAADVAEAMEFMRMFLHLTFTLGLEIEAHSKP